MDGIRAFRAPQLLAFEMFHQLLETGSKIFQLLVKIFRQWLAVSVNGRVALQENFFPHNFIRNPTQLKRPLKRLPWTVDFKTLFEGKFLDDFPGKFKRQFKSQNGRVARQAGFWRGQCLIQFGNDVFKIF